MNGLVDLLSVKPIETTYNGYRFRSRLEARWAVFFDALEIPWEYEPEGFAFDDHICYLPDFWLPEQNKYIEIKPKPEVEGDWPDFTKTGLLAETTGKYSVILCGTPGFPEKGGYEKSDPYCGYYCSSRMAGDFPYIWCECPTCHVIDLQFDGRSARNKHKPKCEIYLLSLENKSHPVYGRTDDKVYNANSPRILQAYNAARAARFEFEDRA